MHRSQEMICGGVNQYNNNDPIRFGKETVRDITERGIVQHSKTLSYLQRKEILLVGMDG